MLRSHVAIFLVLAETQSAVERRVGELARSSDISRYGAASPAGGARSAIDPPPQLSEDLRASLIACTPRDLVKRYRSLMALGMQYFIALVYGNDLETIRLLSREVIPELKRPVDQSVAIRCCRAPPTSAKRIEDIRSSVLMLARCHALIGHAWIQWTARAASSRRR